MEAASSGVIRHNVKTTAALARQMMEKAILALSPGKAIVQTKTLVQQASSETVSLSLALPLCYKLQRGHIINNVSRFVIASPFGIP